MTDESQWSTRYYVADCPDVQMTMRTDGPDARPDPERTACLIRDHGEHPLTRVSRDTWEQITSDDDDDDDDESGWLDVAWEPA